MTSISGISDVTQTTATIVMSDNGSDGILEFQVATRKDFQFCVCPIFSSQRAASIGIRGLNQGTTYWLRARNRQANGVVGAWSASVLFRTYRGADRDLSPAAVMIEPAIFVVPLTPSESFTTGDLPGFPLSNVFRDSPVAWRGNPNVDGHYAFYLRTAGQAIDTVAVLNHNLPETAIMTVGGGGSPDLAIQGADFRYEFPARASPNLRDRPGFHALGRLPHIHESNWMQIVFYNPGVTGDVLSVDHLVVGLNRQSKNHAIEKSETPSPLTTLDRSRSGIADRVRGLPMRKVDFDLDALTEAQFEAQYGDLWRLENEAVFVVPNGKPGSFIHDRMLYGQLTGGKIVNTTSPRYTRSFSVNSII